MNSPVKLLASKAKVLIAEDTKTMRMVLKGMLREVGFNNQAEAIDGNKALSLIKSGAWDLIMCDWELPGAKGDEILKAVRESDNNKDAIFIMCTGVTDMEQVKKVIEAGVSNYITKPFSQAVMNKKLEMYFTLE